MRCCAKHSMMKVIDDIKKMTHDKESSVDTTHIMDVFISTNI